MGLVFYHNPRCSKSREALKCLEEKGHAPRIVRYLEEPPTAAEISALLAKLGISARELMRKNEAPYKDLGLDDPKFSEKALIAMMAAHPVLIERPILVSGKRAVIARPPERVLELL